MARNIFKTYIDHDMVLYDIFISKNMILKFNFNSHHMYIQRHRFGHHENLQAIKMRKKCNMKATKINIKRKEKKNQFVYQSNKKLIIWFSVKLTWLHLNGTNFKSKLKPQNYQLFCFTKINLRKFFLSISEWVKEDKNKKFIE